MSMELSCITCGAIFTSKYHQFECRMCVQTKAIKDQTEVLRKSKSEQKNNDYHNHDNHPQFDYQFISNFQNAVSTVVSNLNNLKQQIEFQKERENFSVKDAYKFGLNYIDSAYNQGNNYIDLHVWINNEGLLSWKWGNQPFLNSDLNDSFFKGLEKNMNRRVVNKDYLNELVYSCGYMLNPSFYFHSDHNICNVKNIGSDTFNTNITEQVNKDTGELIYTWNHPFIDEELNQSYENGVYARYNEENTDELKQKRLEIIKNTTEEKKKIMKINKRDNNITNVIIGIMIFSMIVIAIKSNSTVLDNIF